MSQYYGKDYYDFCCGELPYDDVRWLPFFEQIADNIVKDFAPKTVLDVGCAMGHLVTALRDRGVNAYGIDISDYAVSKVREDIRQYCRVASALEPLPSDLPDHYDLLVTIEVIEHLYEEDSETFIKNICGYADQIIFSSSPNDVAEATHFNVQQPEYWVKRFAKQGFRRNLVYSCNYISKQAMSFYREKISAPRLAEDYERHIRQLSQNSEKKIDEIQQNVDEKLKEIEAINSKLKESQEDILRAEEKITHLEHSLQEQKSAADAAEKAYQDELANTRQENSRLDSELTGARQENGRLDSELAEARQESSRLDSELAEARQENGRLDSELAEARQESSRLDSELAEARQENDRLESEFERTRDTYDKELAQARALVSDLTEEVNRRKDKTAADRLVLGTQIEDLSAEKEAALAEVKKQKQIVSGKEGEILYLSGQVCDEERRIQDQEKQIQDREIRIQDQWNRIQDQENRICIQESQIIERDAQLNSIYGSRCYKLVLKYYRLKDILIPRGSRRFILAKMIFRFPRYLCLGYPFKMIRYIFQHGFHGLGDKIREKVIGPANTPVLDDAQTCVSEAYVPEACVPEAVPVAQNEPQAEKGHAITAIAEVKRSFAVTPHTQNVDVIICVHNAYEDVKRCIESVFEFTTFPYRLILVDDGSDEQTRDYLISIKESSPNVMLMRSDTGTGYTYAANRGLRASSGDYVVLLNSDTIVTPGWLDKMIQCASSHPEIGIVSPLSNTASWQSIPEIFDANGDWCHNKLPDGWSIEAFGRALEKTSAHLYFEVPLLNGFCLMISRETIDHVGYLDEENFGRGFGEEDDYNLRAFRSGVKLAVADDTFVFHAQSKSYTDEKRLALCQDSGKKVRQKHGDQLLDWAVIQMRDNKVFEGIRARAKAMTQREDLILLGKSHWEGKRVLFILPIADIGGGGNIIVQEALAIQKMGVDVSLYNIAGLRPFFEKSYPDMDIPVIYGERLEDVRQYAYEFDAVCSTLNTSVKFTDFTHFEHAPISVYYIQDYEPFFYPEGSCDRCEAERSYTTVKNIVRVTKTVWNAAEVEKHHDVKCNIIGPSVNIDLFRPRKLTSDDQVLKISAMIRPSTPRRSPELTMEVLREIKLKYGDRVEISIFGADCTADAGDARFFENARTDFEFKDYGKLNAAQMAALFGGSDIFVDFSSFQAMGLSAMEAMASGCAVVLPLFGGTGDFAEDGINALVIDTSTKENCINAVEMLINNSSLRDALSKRAIADMCKYAPEYSAYKFLTAVFGED